MSGINITTLTHVSRYKEVLGKCILLPDVQLSIQIHSTNLVCGNVQIYIFLFTALETLFILMRSMCHSIIFNQIYTAYLLRHSNI